ncbi:hypothetical protein [Sphingobacterium zeae]|uniref:Apea-like HEPN domain-containing protein n=1 Tax=Sphingobacterium zeae TaxID=1776859 RepID=A0ABU0U6E6_9SPHI|nr:hypothetical protein [Sphingobacterium zeae]MDQ1150505.1 hypothetical protein [Sphingobacterium zeae]
MMVKEKSGIKSVNKKNVNILDNHFNNNRMKGTLINLKDYSQGRIDTKEISKILNSKIPIEDCFSLTPTELAYKALQHFNFRKLENNKDSITKYCQKILFETKFLRSSNNAIVHFLLIFMDIGKEILNIKNILEQQARKHLSKVEEILAFYKTQPFIIKYIADPVKPGNNHERMQLEFYKRANAKKEEIVEYILRGLLYRAKEKSVKNRSSRLESISKIFEQVDFHEDFPYTELLSHTNKVVYDLNLERIDYRLINPLRNKVAYIDPKHFNSHNYTQTINIGFEKKIKPGHFFERLLQCLKGLPLIEERKEIFKEMQYLLKQKKWYSLYALALPQVEGIFTEMLLITDNKKSKNSLTDKAKIIRTYYENSDYTMDYYEFNLANLRNSFSHTGKIENPKEKCYHLLIDIEYLLNICIDMDTPISKLSKLIRQGYHQIKNIGNFAAILNLLEEIENNKKLASVKVMYEDFMYKEVLTNIDLISMLKKLEKDFVNFAQEFNISLNMLLHDPPLDFFSRPIKDIKPQTKLIEAKMNQIGLLIKDRYKLLVNTKEFLFKFPKYFPNAPATILKTIDNLKRKEDDKLRKIHFLNEHINFNIDDHFFIYEKEMEHSIR